VTRARQALGAALVLLAAATLAACQGAPDGSLGVTPGPNASASLVPPEQGTPVPSAGAASLPPLVSPVEGVVLHVDSPGLGRVTDFTLLTGGRTVTFTVGTLEDPLDFPAAHLAEHVASSEPVLVYFRAEGSDLVVYRLADASASPSPAAVASPSASSRPLDASGSAAAS